MKDDPYVVRLRYHVESAGYVMYDNPPPVEWPTEAFNMQLEEGIAAFQMLEHHTSEEAARVRVEQFLQEWAAYAALQIGRLEVRFEFERAEYSAALPPGPRLFVVDGPRIQVTTRQYPSPPSHFALSPDAETLWRRYERSLYGGEPWPSMGYACLTWLIATEGRRSRVAAKYNVSDAVLRTLKRLTSTVGDTQTARKFEAGRSPRPPTGVEEAWVNAAIARLILRVGQYASDPNRPMTKLTMADLPKLPPTST